MGSVLGKIICPLSLIEYTLFPPLPRIIVCASRGVCMLEVNSSIHTPLEAHTIMRGKGGKRVYSIKLKGQIILPNTDPILPS